jgi:methionyl aminopeptidase
MSITSPKEQAGMQAVSEAVAITLKKMHDFAQIGMNTLELDEYGGKLMQEMGAKSAPRLTYKFPGWTCISVNQEVAHGIPSAKKILQAGDLINIDVSAELDGYWADNGGSFVLGEDTHNYKPLVEASKKILLKAINQIKGGVRIAEIGRFIDLEARKLGYKVIKNLTGHGVGKSLHEEPHEIANYYDRFNLGRFRKNTTVAVETFIATKSSYAYQANDGWTLLGKTGGFVAQHEHTILITDKQPIILTSANGIMDF